MTAPFYARGETGAGIDALAVDGDELVVTMTQGAPTKRVTIPAITAATDAATLASQSATAAAQSESDADTARAGAEAARDAAALSAAAAQTSADDAAGSVTHAEAAETAATAAAGAAAQSKTDADTARTGAESARDAAVTAQTGSESARDASAGSASAAAVAASAAATSSTDADTAKAGAETAATAAATSKAGADDAKAAAESARDAAALSKTGAEAAATTAGGHSIDAAVSAAAAQQSAEDAASVVNDGIPNASSSVKGGIKLAGDLAGTWDAPTVPGLNDRALAARTVTGQGGLKGGGDLTASRILEADFGTTAGKVTEGNDARLSDKRQPVDGSVQTVSLADGAVTAAKLAANSLPHDMTIVAVGEKTARAVGGGDMAAGVMAMRDFTLQELHFRFPTADASGATAVEPRLNGTPISGAGKSVAAADQTNVFGVARSVTGLSVAVAKGDILTWPITAVGGTPGKGLIVEVKGQTK